MILNFIFLLSALLFQNPDSLVFEKAIGNFQNAVSISTSRDEFIFVVDNRTNQVFKYNSKGQMVVNIGGSGFGQNEFNKPMGIDASSGIDVFVCDYQNDRIQRFDNNLNYFETFDFNNYNVTADNSSKIFYPASIAYLTTSDIFVLADASVYKVVKLKSLDEVSLLFCSGNLGVDKLYNPVKVVRGANLDIYIMDKYTNDIINFDSYGTFVKRLKNLDNDTLINISYYGDKLYILKTKYLVIYDMKSQKYSGLYYFNLPEKNNAVDLGVLNQNNILILTPKQILNYIINQ